MTWDLDPARIVEAAGRLNLLVITPLGRSGSMLVQSLFDGHPNVACMSEVSQNWGHYRRFLDDGGDIDRWLESNPEFWDARNFAKASGAAAEMPSWFPDRRATFVAAFNEALGVLEDAGSRGGRAFWAAIAIAWATVRGQDLKDLQYLVVQHHNHRGLPADLPRIFRDFPEARVLATCRHPIESGLSFLTLDRRTGHPSFRNFSRNVRGWSAACWRHLEAAVKAADPDNQLRLLDLNALHRDPEGMLERLCRWLGIQRHDALRSATMFGIDWSGNSADGRPIPTFEGSRAELLYPGTIGNGNGLSVDEYRFAEWLTRGVCEDAGYRNSSKVARTGFGGFLWILVRRMEWYRSDTIAHDRGVRRLARRLGAVEALLVLREAIMLRRRPRLPFGKLRLDCNEATADG